VVIVCIIFDQKEAKVHQRSKERKVTLMSAPARRARGPKIASSSSRGYPVVAKTSIIVARQEGTKETWCTVHSSLCHAQEEECQIWIQKSGYHTHIINTKFAWILVREREILQYRPAPPIGLRDIRRKKKKKLHLRPLQPIGFRDYRYKQNCIQI
jgi:hypothetical protein